MRSIIYSKSVRNGQPEYHVMDDHTHACSRSFKVDSLRSRKGFPNRISAPGAEHALAAANGPSSNVETNSYYNFHVGSYLAIGSFDLELHRYSLVGCKT